MIQCIHGMDERFCATCQRRHDRTSPVPPAAPRARRLRRENPHLHPTFGGTPPVLRIQADPAGGWRLRKKGHCFSSAQTIDGIQDERLRITVSLFPRRRRYNGMNTDNALLLAATASSPNLNDQENSLQGVRLCVTAGRIALAVPIFSEDGTFNRELAWSMSSSGKPKLYRVFRPSMKAIDDESPVPMPHRYPAGVGFEDGKLLWTHVYRLELQMLIVVQPPTAKPLPRYFEWERRFFPGGLPSLGKR